MNWGKKIVVLYSGFVIMILSMVFLASRHRVELVADNYYEQELKFQDKIDKINRSNHLLHPVTVDFVNGKLLIGFPAEINNPVSGTISVYSPLKKSNDRVFTIETKPDFTQSVDLTKLPSGVYHIQIDWKADDVSYYNEKTINI